MDERPVTELAVNGLTRAVRKRRPEPGTVHHSDCGTQYRRSCELFVNDLLPAAQGMLATRRGGAVALRAGR